MAYRAGSYDAAKPIWRGVIRDDSYPAFVCNHDDHKNQREATVCSRAALAQIKKDNSLPPGWVEWNKEMLRDNPE
jgi:hypothetical protein